MLIATLVFLTVVTSTLSQPDPAQSCLCFQELEASEQMYIPTTITHANDGSGRLFVTESRGVIWIFRPNGTRDETPFLTLSPEDVFLTIFSGLMAFTVHPDFSNNGLFYVAYTTAIDGEIYHRFSEFSVSISNPDIADPNSERVVLEAYYGEVLGHHGGGLLFGDDGYLYFTLGDGTCCYDPLQNGQNRSTILAAMNRIDVDSRTGELPYGIPPDNPFLDDPESRPEIYAYGFRNPFTATFDTGDRDTGEGRGRIFIGDVGEVSFEEIDYLEYGGNYGWSVWEGSECIDMDRCDDIGSHIQPIIDYNRTYGITVLVGGVYRGFEMPAFSGRLIFADYGTTNFFSGTEQSPGAWGFDIIPKCDICPSGTTPDHMSLITVLGTDEQGEMYFASVFSSTPDAPVGSIYKVSDPYNSGKSL